MKNRSTRTITITIGDKKINVKGHSNMTQVLQIIDQLEKRTGINASANAPNDKPGSSESNSDCATGKIAPKKRLAKKAKASP